MPYHSEMSDALFMAGPILASTGKLTGEQKYFDACATHSGIDAKTLPARGWHLSPLAARRSGLGARQRFSRPRHGLGAQRVPGDHPRRAELLVEFQKHMTVLLKHQDADGCWHQVIDQPESYREFTATSMIGWAMLRGVRKRLARKRKVSAGDRPRAGERSTCALVATEGWWMYAPAPENRRTCGRTTIGPRFSVATIAAGRWA